MRIAGACVQRPVGPWALLHDRGGLERILTEKSKSCPAGAEACSGNTAATSSTGAGYWKADVAGALIYAPGQFMERDAKVTHLLWNNVDFVGGHQLQLTNADKSRTLAAIYMHENKLCILEGTVPSRPPGLSVMKRERQILPHSRTFDLAVPAYCAAAARLPLGFEPTAGWHAARVDDGRMSAWPGGTR